MNSFFETLNSGAKMDVEETSLRFNFEKWISTQRELLVLEKDAEVEQMKEQIEGMSAGLCEEKGVSLLGLYVQEATTALFGTS